MQHRNFMYTLGAGITGMSLSAFAKETENWQKQDVLMPLLFVGHGNPMNAIEDNEFSRRWKQEGAHLPIPRAIICISAHWQTRGTFVTAADKPETIHDFGGFPKALFDQQYPAPGSPEIAKLVAESVKISKVELDHEWGLDHGTWSVLLPMFPKADIPVLQLSLDYSKPPEYHFQLAEELKKLREKGVLIIGSGNIFHNLGLFKMTDAAYDWAIEFDAKIKEKIESGDFQAIVNYKQFGRMAQLSVPTNEHFLPLLYTLALKDSRDQLSFFNTKTTAGSISMTSVKLS